MGKWADEFNECVDKHVNLFWQRVSLGIAIIFGMALVAEIVGFLWIKHYWAQWANTLK